MFKIAIISYPEVLKSAVHGLEEMFVLANRICSEQKLEYKFEVDIIDSVQVASLINKRKKYNAIVLPPTIQNQYYETPDISLIKWLTKKNSEGSILCSACAGAFILAETKLLDNRSVTTHWGLVNKFHDKYPKVELNTNKILINDGDIITAGGMMSWLDLGLEIIAQFTKPIVMRQLGKVLVVDTGEREQRFYKQFTPILNHGDILILEIQKKIQMEYDSSIKISEVAQNFNLTERTLLRRFVNATGYKPIEYLQKARIQKVCDLLENENDPFEKIVFKVGYSDVSACRKIFIREMGLTPSEFRKRFSK